MLDFTKSRENETESSFEELTHTSHTENEHIIPNHTTFGI